MPLGADDGEIVAAELWAAGTTGIQERPDALLAGFTERDQAHRAAAALGGTVRTVSTADILDGQRGLVPTVEAGPFCVHPPEQRPPDGLLGISVDPGHAFGTGSHPSTRLALELLADAVTAGARVADIGCGSGILAIGAARLGARVEAVDHDPAAVTATRANVAANRVIDRVRVSPGSVDAITGPVDIAVINMTIDIHERLAGPVLALRPSTVIVTGILGDQVDRTLACYRGRETQRRAEGEWVGLRLDL